MHMDNRHRVDEMLHVLRDALGNYVIRVYKEAYKGEQYLAKLQHDFNQGKHQPQLTISNEGSALTEADVPRWLNCIVRNSKNIFAFKESRSYARTWAEELLNARNIWAHQGKFEDEELRRIADTAALLLEELGLPGRAHEVRAISSKSNKMSSKAGTSTSKAQVPKAASFAPIDSDSAVESITKPLGPDFPPQNLDYLNEQQRNAVTAGPDGPILVNAGPGSGKTKVLTERVLWLVQEHGVSPENILGMTFTKKATAEMEGRVLLALGKEWGKRIRIGTIHSICWEILRKESRYLPWRATPSIVTNVRQRNVVVTALRELEPDKHRYQFPQNTLVDNILTKIAAAKNHLVQPEQYKRHFQHLWDSEPEIAEIVNKVYPLYVTMLKDSNAMDHSDQLIWAERLIRENKSVRDKYQEKFQYILVDEFQDLNRAQYVLMRHLGQPQDNVFVVGDEDQSIYGWRGADTRNFVNFRHDYPGALVLSLEQNYRSTQHILNLGKKLTNKNATGSKKDLFTSRKQGIVPQVGRAENEFQEADLVAQKIAELSRGGLNYRDCAVLSRQSYALHPVQEALTHSGIPCGLSGAEDNRLFGLDEVQDLLAYLKLCIDFDQEFSFLRVLNTPRRNIGPATRSQFHQWRREEGLSVGEALVKLIEGNPPKLRRQMARVMERQADVTRQIGYLREFANLLHGWRVPARQERMTMLFDRIILQTDYIKFLHTYGRSTDKARERENNLDRLRQYLKSTEDQGKDLKEFLAVDELVAMSGAEQDSQTDEVSLIDRKSVV